MSSSSDIGDSVYTLNLQEAVTTSIEEPTTTTAAGEMGAKRRRRGEPMGHITGEHDILLDNESANFAITFCKLRGSVEIRCVFAMCSF